MTCEYNIRVGTIGVKLELEILEGCEPNLSDLDITLATTKTITIERPDSTIFTRTASFSTTGIDGRVYILTIDGDLTIEGTYHIQAYLVLPAWSGYSSIGEFDVYDNLV